MTSPLPYRLPAEWEPMQSVWFTFPHNADTWVELLPKVQGIFLEFLPKASLHAEVHVCVQNKTILDKMIFTLTQNSLYTLNKNESHRISSLESSLTTDTIQQSLKNQNSISPKDNSTVLYPSSSMNNESRNTLHLHLKKTNDSWIRDYGALTVHTSNQKRLLSFQFNSWGGKYPPWEDDNTTPTYMGEALEIPVEEIPFIFEGGSIDVNGQGIGLTTRNCLLNPNRNPGVTEKQVEELLLEKLGIQKLIWLDGELVGDDTDGHIDQLARFVNPKTIVYTAEKNPDAPNFRALKAMEEELLIATHPLGIKCIPIQIPSRYEVLGIFPPASYLNFLIVNQSVFIPQFQDPQDPITLQLFAQLFPQSSLIPIPSRELVYGQGGIHCLSQCVFR